jgi:hypothetical protein
MYDSSNKESDYGSQHLENPHSTGAETEDSAHSNHLGSPQLYDNKEEFDHSLLARADVSASASSPVHPESLAD